MRVRAVPLQAHRHAPANTHAGQQRDRRRARVCASKAARASKARRRPVAPKLNHMQAHLVPSLVVAIVIARKNGL